MAKSQFHAVTKVVGEYSGALGGASVAFVTAGIEQLTTLAVYRCPCVNPSRLTAACLNFSAYSGACTPRLNLTYGLSLILTPALSLFLFGVVINPKMWKTVTGFLKKTPQYRKNTTDLSWTLLVVFSGALISPAAWICIALVDGRYLACALTHLPYDVGRTGSLYATCEKLSQAKVSYPSDAFRNNRAFSQVVGAATVAGLLLLGFLAYCLSRCTFPLTYYHAKYFGVYRQYEEAEFDDEIHALWLKCFWVCFTVT